jgi:hypothetical protein
MRHFGLCAVAHIVTVNAFFELLGASRECHRLAFRQALWGGSAAGRKYLPMQHFRPVNMPRPASRTPETIFARHLSKRAGLPRALPATPGGITLCEALARSSLYDLHPAATQ